jgi:hypothetical protein
MPNKWVEFVKKWSAENNMNYMCAMTTKECKEAYLKEYPKEPKKTKSVKSKYGLNKSDDVDVVLSDIANMKFGDKVLNDVDTENKIKEIAKKHKIDISKFIDGKGELDIFVEDVLEGVRYGKSKKVSDFFDDFYDIIVDVKKKAEQMEMAEEDVPAPAPPAKKVIIRKKKAKEVAPNTALSRFQEAETNPALKVLTNADLLKLIGSFTKGMDKPYTAVKGVRGKLRDSLLAFFTPIFQNSDYKTRWYGRKQEPTDDLNDGDIEFQGIGSFEWKDIVDMVKKITLQTGRYSQKDIGGDAVRGLVYRLFKGGNLKVEKYHPSGLARDREMVEIPIPAFKDSKYKYDDFRADPNA